MVDSPHGGGKIPVMPNYLISASDDAVVLRNFEGQIVRYQAQDKPATVEPTVTRGVSSLLQGTRSVIVPEGSERMARRALRVLDNEPAATAPARMGQSPTKRLRSKSRFRPARGVPQPGGERGALRDLGLAISPRPHPPSPPLPSPKRRGGNKTKARRSSPAAKTSPPNPLSEAERGNRTSNG